MTRDPWDVALDLIDPPPPTPEQASPLTYGITTGRGDYHRARHLELIETAALHTINTAGRLIVSVSVRTGKSDFLARRLAAWYLGRNPNKRVIVATHMAEFAKTHGGWARDNLTEHGPDTFDVHVSTKSRARNFWELASPHTGGMLTLGVGGSPIGRGADLLIIDDPYGSFADAMSPTIRQAVIDWWTGTMVSRIEPGGAVIIICSRWHEDDLSGFLLREQPDRWTELRMPAICDDPAGDPMGRAAGEALWPERWPVEALEQIRADVTLTLGDAVWAAQYQQAPRTPTGGMFPIDRWGRIDPGHVALIGARWVRGWDLAATDGGGDFTVGAKVGRLVDGRTAVADVRRGQWSTDEVREQIKAAAADDGPGVAIELPQDPAQAGKDQAQQLVRMLAGFDVEARIQSGDKPTRAAGLSAQQRAGNVVLVDGEWIQRFIVEHQAFPRGRHDDQVDAASAAFNRLAGVVDVPGGGGGEEYPDERLRGSR